MRKQTARTQHPVLTFKRRDKTHRVIEYRQTAIADNCPAPLYLCHVIRDYL